MTRKYTRKTSRDNLQSKSKPLKGKSSNSLPPAIIKSIEKIAEHRKALGLFDDSKERIERALRYQEFRNGKT